MASIERDRSLIYGAVRAPEEEIDGASQEQLTALRTRLRRDLPTQLTDLLAVCNGARIGPGGLFGQRPEEPYLDLPSVLALFPAWTAHGWIPVGGDGCGNYDVLRPERQCRLRRHHERPRSPSGHQAPGLVRVH